MAEAKYLHQNRLLQNQSMLTCQRIQVLQSNTSFIHFPFNNFRYFLTLFSKFFSSFLHSTCSLSDSRQYLALEGIYLPIRTAVPNNPTRRRRIVRAGTQAQTGLSPSLALRSRRLVPLPLLMAASVDYNSPGWEILRLSFSRFTRRY